MQNTRTARSLFVQTKSDQCILCGEFDYYTAQK